MLARRAYSVAEMRRALERKFPSHPAIEDSIARLRSLGYLDDRKYAEQLASSLARNRAWGRHRIRRELKARLVDYRLIEPALDRAFEESDERQLLERALDRRLRSMRLPLTPRKLQSLVQSLLRRGFASSDIMKAVRSRPELKPVAEGLQVAGLEVEKDASRE
jgi:regulatory protein